MSAANPAMSRMSKANLLAAAEEARDSKHGFQLVKHEHVDNIENIKEKMKELQKRYPKEVETFQTQYATKLVLHKQQKVIEHMKHEGEVTKLDATPLLNAVDKALGDLYKPGFREMLSKEAGGARHMAGSASSASLERGRAASG